MDSLRALSGASASCPCLHLECRRSIAAWSQRASGSAFFGSMRRQTFPRRHAARATASSAEEDVISTSSSPASRGFGTQTWKQPVKEPTSAIIPPPPSLSGRALRSGWNATALAYLGDAVWELYARRSHFAPPKRLTALYDLVTASVRAEAQAAFAEALEAGGFLSEEEKDILRWGKNAKVTVPKRFVGGKDKDRGPRGSKGKKGGSVVGVGPSAAAAETAAAKVVAVSGPHANVYRSATALECLVGYLYIVDPRRLHEVMLYVGLGGLEGEGEDGDVGPRAAALAPVGGAGSTSASSGHRGVDDDGGDREDEGRVTA